MASPEENPEEFVRENQERILAVIRRTEDPFMRACAWALLDRFTPNQSLEEIREELDVVSDWGNDS